MNIEGQIYVRNWGTGCKMHKTTISSHNKKEKEKKRKEGSKEGRKRKETETNIILKEDEEARQWWHTPLIPALGRQRKADF